MKPLKPSATLLGGTLMMAAAVWAGSAIVLPEFRTPRGAAICLAWGAAFGLLLFGPIAAGGALRSGFVRRHFEHFDRWSAMVLAMGLGHVIGSRLGGAGTVAASLAITLAALFRIYLGVMAERGTAARE